MLSTLAIVVLANLAKWYSVPYSSWFLYQCVVFKHEQVYVTVLSTKPREQAFFCMCNHSSDVPLHLINKCRAFAPHDLIFISAKSWIPGSVSHQNPVRHKYGMFVPRSHNIMLHRFSSWVIISSYKSTACVLVNCDEYFVHSSKCL